MQIKERKEQLRSVIQNQMNHIEESEQHWDDLHYRQRMYLYKLDKMLGILNEELWEK
jgi:hypothetical protein